MKAEEQSRQMFAEMQGKLIDAVDAVVSRQRAYFVGKPDTLTTNNNKGIVKMSVTVPRRDVPLKTFAHEGVVMVILLDREMSLEELQGQLELDVDGSGA